MRFQPTNLTPWTMTNLDTIFSASNFLRKRMMKIPKGNTLSLQELSNFRFEIGEKNLPGADVVCVCFVEERWWTNENVYCNVPIRRYIEWELRQHHEDELFMLSHGGVDEKFEQLEVVLEKIVKASIEFFEQV